MEASLAKSQSAASAEHHAENAQLSARLPEADKMSLEAWEHDFKGTDKQVKVPIMLEGVKFDPLSTRSVLKANDPVTSIYMQARESMGKVMTPDGFVGSGFFVDKDGLFSTLYHVAENFKDMQVKTGDGQLHQAHLVSSDPANDTVLLQVDKNDPQETFHTLKVGSFNDLKPGERVLACGFGVDPVLHCSPGKFDFTMKQKAIKLDLHPGEVAPPFDPERLLAHAEQHTVNGDSGGVEFRLSDGTVRMLVDMTDNKRNTVSIPADQLLSLEQKFRDQKTFQNDVFPDKASSNA